MNHFVSEGEPRSSIYKIINHYLPYKQLKKHKGSKINSIIKINIEMKKSIRPEAEKISDRKRLRTMTKDSYDGVWSWEGEAHPEHVCGYLLGVYVIVNIARRSCLK